MSKPELLAAWGKDLAADTPSTANTTSWRAGRKQLRNCIPPLYAFATMAEGAADCVRRGLSSAVTSLPPFKFVIKDWIVKIGPQGIPHQPATRLSRLQGSPLLIRLS